MATFEHEGTTYTIKTETVKDRLNAQIIEGVIATQRPEARYWHVVQFANWCVTVSVPDDASTPTASASDDPNAIAGAFDAWLDMDVVLYDAWEAAQRSEKKV